MSETIPDKPEKHAWRRRYTDLVHQQLAQPSKPSPADSGDFAKAQVRAEWNQRFPGEPVPDWMP